MKKYTILFWVTAGLIFLTQGLMPVLTINSEGARQAMQHLGYPVYFGKMLAIFKFLGGLAIIIPKVPHRIKEWAFAGYAIDFISAFISFTIVDGLGGFALFPLVAVLILILCYYSWNKQTEWTGNQAGRIPQTI